VRGHTARQLHQLARVSGEAITSVLLLEELHELLKFVQNTQPQTPNHKPQTPTMRVYNTGGRDEEEEVRADAFVGAIDLFPCVAPQQQPQLLSEFKNILASCCEEQSSSPAARAFNRCVVRQVGPLYVTLGRSLYVLEPLASTPLFRIESRCSYADEADCSFFLSSVKVCVCVGV